MNPEAHPSAAGGLDATQPAKMPAPRHFATTDDDERRRNEEAERRARATQSFWTVAVGVPAIVSVLRLVVEAGGELQTTLLLVANVNPVNLVAAFVTTSTRMASALLVLLFAISAVLAASVGPGTHRTDRDPRPLVVRWKNVAPMWFAIVVVVVAFATWQLLYLPLLLLGTAAMFQLSPNRLHPSRKVQAALIVPIMLGYGWLLAPTLRDAWLQGEFVVIALLLVPPVLALVIAGPLHRLTVRPLATIGPLLLLVAMLWTAYSVVTTPVLPLTVTTVETARSSFLSPNDPDATEDIRGHVIYVNDIHAVILQEHGGVRYVPTDEVRAQVLCPSERDLTRYRLWIRGFHVEDSILEGLGRQKRPSPPVDVACRIAS